MSWFERAGAEILRLISRSSDPGGAASELQVFAKAAELYAQNASGDVYQYTPHLRRTSCPRLARCSGSTPVTPVGAC